MWLPVVGMLREMKFGIARVGIILRTLHAQVLVQESRARNPSFRYLTTKLEIYLS
jgi:hypothetical protein